METDDDVEGKYMSYFCVSCCGAQEEEQKRSLKSNDKNNKEDYYCVRTKTYPILVLVGYLQHFF